MKKIEIFSSDKCKQCIELKKYLKEKNINYTEYNISGNDENRKTLINLGYMSVPVLLIDGNHVLGFDKSRIDSLLEL
ncbi:glutaredoxin family protein [[Clostridium] bifermentans ATCC 638]|uniref:Glutaredoxin family protein n=1 Tax=Paraclostridium bifermentans ATCC 638 = DSM 14991 TaxID=1233171 RepID=T4VUZ1_PARBF|nr:glutaredoxin family protein [Paraclostridium bifermentans]EQK45248.1 glutaredoxin family protein [[Clostridium] bifermentans ATCC 638] [Paraclostridium bifermentans ATCC 638 = DSM 14991]RIZ57307.1 NrdH-redoxin [Paraclostridium bifermentans]UAG18230.1 glutaredoxin family protein [Paraclostridium bifermentans]